MSWFCFVTVSKKPLHVRFQISETFLKIFKKKLSEVFFYVLYVDEICFRASAGIDEYILI